MKKVNVGYIGWLSYDDTDFSVPYAVCDVNEQKLKDYAAKHPGVKIFTDWKKLAEDPELDVVIISTPNQFHLEMGTAFLRKGVHVFLEKPMGVNRKEMNQLLLAQRKSGKQLAIDFEMRASCGTIRTKEIIDSGELGAMQGIEFVHHRGSWLYEGNHIWRLDRKLSGGLYFMEICHEVDYFRFLMGEITHVQSFKMPNVLPQYGSDFPDNVFSILSFENGSIGTISASHTLSCQNASMEEYNQKGHDMFFVYTGTLGSMRLDCINDKLLVTQFEPYPEGSHGKRVMFKRIEDFHGTNAFHDTDTNRLRFIESCACGIPHLQDAYDAWRSHCVCLAAEESALKGFRKMKVDYTEP